MYTTCIFIYSLCLYIGLFVLQLYHSILNLTFTLGSTKLAAAVVRWSSGFLWKLPWLDFIEFYVIFLIGFPDYFHRNVARSDVILSVFSAWFENFSLLKTALFWAIKAPSPGRHGSSLCVWMGEPCTAGSRMVATYMLQVDTWSVLPDAVL